MRGLRNQRGGAVVELGVFTFVFVPLALYGAWFADTIHMGIKLQEASIVPAWDVTAHLLHNSQNGIGTNNYNPAMTKAVSDIVQDMGTSFDSTDSGGSSSRASVLVKPDNLTTSNVNCKLVSAPNSDSDWTTRPLVAIDWKPTMDTSRRPTNTWVSCTSTTKLHTTGFQTDFDQARAGNVKLITQALTTLTLCGIGPGFSGCGSGGNSNGFLMMNDDWGLEYGAQNTLNPGSASGNQAYFTLAKEYFTAAGSPSVVSVVVGGFGDQGNTTAFRLTYRRGSQGGYGNDAEEDQHGQSGPHGGPSKPHTGGAWHEESSAHPNVSQNSWSTRVDAHYLGVSAFPADGT